MALLVVAPHLNGHVAWCFAHDNLLNVVITVMCRALLFLLLLLAFCGTDNSQRDEIDGCLTFDWVARIELRFKDSQCKCSFRQTEAHTLVHEILAWRRCGRGFARNTVADLA